MFDAADNPAEYNLEQSQTIMRAYGHLFDVTTRFSSSLRALMNKKKMVIPKTIVERGELADIWIGELSRSTALSLRIKISICFEKELQELADCTHVHHSDDAVFFEPVMASAIFKEVRPALRKILADFAIPQMKTQIMQQYESAGEYEQLQYLDDRLGALYDHMITATLPFERPPTEMDIWIPPRTEPPAPLL